MIFYITESLNSKKNGGSSLSGLDFLQLLRIHYKGVSVVSYDGVADEGAVFYGHEVSPLSHDYIVKTIYKPKKMDFLRKVKSFLISIKNLFKPLSVDLNGSGGIIFVNSWSTIMESNQVKGIENFTKVCIVRGNPESFVWQGENNDADINIRKAADYLDLFDILIFVSQIGLERWQPYISDDIESYYLPNSINELEVSSLLSKDVPFYKAELGFDSDVLNLVAVGSVQVRKGQDILLDVASILHEKKFKFKIHVVGVVSKQWGGDEIKNKICESDLSGYFIFHGHREDALSFAYAADVCLFPSRAEAFPRTVAEYMCLGKPIVSTDVSGVPEMIEHGVSGLLCPQDDACLMAEHIATLANNISLSAQMGVSAREKYLGSFSKSNQIKRAGKIFSDLS